MKPSTLTAPSKPIFTKTPATLCASSSAWNSRLLLPLFSPLCHACCAGYKNTKTTCISRSGKCHFAEVPVLVFSVPWKWRPTSLLTNLHGSTVWFLLVLKTVHVCFFLFLEQITLPLYAWYVLSSLDLNNGCSPSDWHHTESLFSACPAVENRTVKVIRAERCTL